MSLWTSSLPSLFMVLVLTIVVMQSGCNAATAAVQRASPSPSLRCTSTKELKDIVDTITSGLHRLEESIRNLTKPLSVLQGQYRSYSARTARHGWQSVQQQCVTTEFLRRDAQKLRSQIRGFDQVVRNQFKPKLVMLQSPLLRLLARDAPTQTQLAQSAKIYKRILELLQNMIECPVNILQFLGEDSTEGEDDDTPSEPVYYR
ncbi:uncharacterized protein LOC135700635 isoform X2 [Ochlerotatus camptorhynchus]|uniref:uncharacterized protein LOC135700635 isoform X2 n=1 Tax=Ochlerotatus camptorhynchus TaxID=644619 RepID=UPI0031E31AAA